MFSSHFGASQKWLPHTSSILFEMLERLALLHWWILYTLTRQFNWHTTFPAAQSTTAQQVWPRHSSLLYSSHLTSTHSPIHKPQFIVGLFGSSVIWLHGIMLQSHFTNFQLHSQWILSLAPVPHSDISQIKMWSLCIQMGLQEATILAGLLLMLMLIVN